MSTELEFRTWQASLTCLEAPREGQASYVHVHEIIAGLQQRGWTVALYAPSYSGQWHRPRLTLRLLHYCGLQLRLAWDWRHYDIIYVRGHPAAFGVALLARWTGKSIVHEINGTYEDLYVAYPGAAPWRRVLNALHRWQFRAASGLVAVTDRLSEWLRRETAGTHVRIATIPNGANTEIFHPDALRRAGLPARYAVFCGGLSKWHGVGTMLDAVKTLGWPAALALVIVGDGPESAAVESAAAGDPRIVALGRLPYHDVPGVVAGASVGLVTISDPGGRSTMAGLSPLKLYELLACGVPVVVTDLPGMVDFVRNSDCGLIVPVDDPGATATAVATLAGDPARAKAMGQRGQTAVRLQHSWDARAADTATLLDALVRDECPDQAQRSSQA